MKIKVMEKGRTTHGTREVAGYLPGRVLRDLCVVPHVSLDHKGNRLFGRYQRPKVDTSQSRLKDALVEGKIDLHGSILLNLRAEHKADAEKYLTIDEHGQLWFDMPDDEIDKRVQAHGGIFHLADGQQRQGGFRAAMAYLLNKGHIDEEERVGDIPVLFELMFGAHPEDEERIAYITINETQSGMSTEHLRAADFIKNALEEKNRDLAAKLAQRSFWRGRIHKTQVDEKTGKAKRAAKGQLRESQIITSLTPISKESMLDIYTTDERATIVDAYWQGILAVAPNTIDPKTLRDYSVMKAVGINILNDLLPHAIKMALTMQLPLTQPKTYERLLTTVVDDREWVKGKVGTNRAFQNKRVKELNSRLTQHVKRMTDIDRAKGVAA